MPDHEQDSWPGLSLVPGRISSRRWPLRRCQVERLQRKWTQDGLARQTKITQSNISAIGRRRIHPTRKELDALVV